MSSPDAQKPQVAPAPPPPPEVERELGRRKRSFDMSSKRASAEFLIITGLIVGAGVGAYVTAGALAAWMTPLIPMSVDRTIGEASVQGMMASPCNDPRAQRYVERIAAPLLEQAEPLPFEFSFRVADDPAINAYALPGGFVTVNRGLLEAAESGEEVAGVIGHEIQHALLRHGTRRVLRQLGGAVILSLLTGGGDVQALSEAAARMTSLSYDRDQESEADEHGVRLMVAAGIDPRGLGRFFERLEKEAGPTPPELLSTHPSPGDRARLVSDAAEGQTFRELPPPPADVCRPNQVPTGSPGRHKDRPEGSF